MNGPGELISRNVIIAAIVAAGLLLLSFTFNGEPAPTEPPEVASALPTRSMLAPKSTTVIDIAQAYSANEARAQRDFGDRPLLVTATLDRVDLDMSDKPVLYLRGIPGDTMSGADLIPESAAGAADLVQGKKVLLLCQDVSELLGTPELHGCSIMPFTPD